MEWVTPGHPAYDEARAVWNGRFESRPDVIARVAGAQDVVEALGRARAEGLAVTVKSGGHDYAGHSAADGGLLIDLSPMDRVEVDAAASRVKVGAGARWSAVDRATQEHGLATTGGTVSSVGVAGFTLGGGEGWLSRKHGFACDNLLAAEVVTAGGEIVRASETENPELLWGLRGAGANLGVVTSLELALHPLDHEILAGQVIYPFERAPELLRFYRDHFERGVPDTVGCFPFFYRVPPLDLFPEAWHGRVVFAFVVACLAPVEEGEGALAPFRDLGDPILDGIFPQSYVDFQTAFDAGMSASGNRWYTRAHGFSELPDGCIDALVGAIEPLPGDFTTVYLGAADGAVSRRAPDATAYPHRSGGHGLHIFPGWTDPAQDAGIMAWARGVSDAVAPFAASGVYINMLAEDEKARVRASYGPNWDRLVALKARWDPENVFRSNKNVPPNG